MVPIDLSDVALHTTIWPKFGSCSGGSKAFWFVLSRRCVFRGQSLGMLCLESFDTLINKSNLGFEF